MFFPNEDYGLDMIGETSSDHNATFLRVDFVKNDFLLEESILKSGSAQNPLNSMTLNLFSFSYT